MSNLVLSAGGAAVGFFLGGPTGAQIGWLMGSAYAASKQTIDQTTAPGDLRIMTAQYGVAIPYTFGKQRVAGNILWADEKKTYDIKTKQGKGGPSVVTTGTTISFAMGLCAGPILGVSKVWANEKLLIDSSTEVKPLCGELYLGSMTQMPDPTMETKEGAGNVPAYRGLAYIVMKDLDITKYGGMVPQLSFEVVRGATL